MNNVQANCFPVCTSSEVKKKPKGVVLLNTPLALFRNSKGVIQVLYDRCPHRGAPISKGHVQKDMISCPYHGWTFSGSGSCKLIPGMKCMKERSLYNIPSYFAFERYGLIWVNLKGDVDCIPKISELSDNLYSTFTLNSAVDVGLVDVIENVLDPMHTHFVHQGWIRSNKDLKPHKVVLSTDENSVEASYLEAEPQQGLIYQLLTIGRTISKSWGRFIYPNTVQLEYVTNKNDHLLITAFVCPIRDDQSRIFLFSSCRTKLPFFLFKGMMKQLFKVALKQDRKILNMLGEHRKNVPVVKKVSTYVDLIGPHVEQLLAGHRLPKKTSEVTIYV